MPLQHFVHHFIHIFPVSSLLFSLTPFVHLSFPSHLYHIFSNYTFLSFSCFHYLFSLSLCPSVNFISNIFFTQTLQSSNSYMPIFFFHLQSICISTSCLYHHCDFFSVSLHSFLCLTIIHIYLFFSISSLTFCQLALILFSLLSFYSSPFLSVCIFSIFFLHSSFLLSIIFLTSFMYFTVSSSLLRPLTLFSSQYLSILHHLLSSYFSQYSSDFLSIFLHVSICLTLYPISLLFFMSF